MLKMKNEGFTLVELLIVIAIVGILSSIVMANLGQSRTQALDAKVVAQLAHVRESGELYHITHGNYGTATYSCTGGIFTDTESGMASYTDAANYPDGQILICNSSGSAFAVSGSLASSTTWWCVDNLGASKFKDTTIGSSTTCN